MDLRERFEKYVDRSGECHVWTGAIAARQYGAIKVNGKTLRAHRVAYELAHGTIPDRMEVCHRCDNPRCVRVDHLFIGTHAENMADMRNKKRESRGPSHAVALRGKQHWRKLNKEQEAEIVRRRGRGELLRTLAAEFGVSESVVSEVARGRRVRERTPDGRVRTVREAASEEVRRSIIGHADEVETYTHVREHEQRAAIGAVVRLVKGGG